MDVCIKGIDEHKWKKFKAQSAREGVNMGEFFSKLVEEYEKNKPKSNWHTILTGSKPLKGIINKEEFETIRMNFRQNFKMRGK